VAITFTNTNDQQEALCLDALARLRVSGASLFADLAVHVVDAPSEAGHRDFMGLADSTIEVRSGLDNPTSPFLPSLASTEQVEFFFRECFAHQLGHLLVGGLSLTDAQKATIGSCFYKQGATGEGPLRGTLADWHSLGDAWEDRIVEAVAETFKDFYLPPEARVFDNRTNWTLDASMLARFWGVLLPSGDLNWQDTFDTDSSGSYDSLLGPLTISGGQLVDGGAGVYASLVADTGNYVSYRVVMHTTSWSPTLDTFGAVCGDLTAALYGPDLLGVWTLVAGDATLEIAEPPADFWIEAHVALGACRVAVWVGDPDGGGTRIAHLEEGP
jgi:hypothetical protein